MSKKQVGTGFTALVLLLLFLAGSASAVEIRSGDMVTVSEGKIKGPLFISGNSVTIDSDVDGDLYAAGQTVVVNGRVDGDVMAAGQNLRVNGTVTGSLRVAGNEIEVGGLVERSLTAMANTINLRENSRVKRDVLLFGNMLELRGAVEGQVMGSGQQFRLNGPINGDVRIWNVDNLKVAANTVIGGTLTYGSRNRGDISSEAKINAVSWLEQMPKPEKPEAKQEFSWLGVLGWFAAGVLLWGIIKLLFPQFLPGMGRLLSEAPWLSLGWGFLILLLTPLAVLILLVTVVGIPLSILLFLGYVFLLYAAKIVVGDAAGHWVAQHFNWEGRIPAVVLFMVAFLALILLTNIPVIGFFINLAVACLALGLTAMAFYQWRTRKKVLPQSNEDVS